MNIRQAVDFSSLRQGRPSSVLREKKSAVEITSRIFSKAEESGQPIVSINASGWSKEWLASETFFLINLPMHLASVPRAPEDTNKVLSSMNAATDSMEPIVVDMNKNQIGKQPNGAFFPPVIVVDGRHRHRAVQLQGRERIQAWVGELAAQHLGLLHADHQIGSSELQSKLREKLMESYPRPAKSDGLPDYSLEYKTPWIQEVYPLENYFVYQYDNDLFRQGYKIEGKTREVSFIGKKKEVVQRYINAGAEKPKGKPVNNMEASMQIFASVPFQKIKATGTGGPGASLGSGSGPAKPGMTKMPPVKATGYYGYQKASQTQSDKTKGGSKSEMVDKLKGQAEKVKKIVTKYRAAIKAGYQHQAHELKAVAPPGMEKTVKGLKKHVGKKSAFKLAWWMHNKKGKS